MASRSVTTRGAFARWMCPIPEVFLDRGVIPCWASGTLAPVWALASLLFFLATLGVALYTVAVLKLDTGPALGFEGRCNVAWVAFLFLMALATTDPSLLERPASRCGAVAALEEQLAQESKKSVEAKTAEDAVVLSIPGAESVQSWRAGVYARETQTLYKRVREADEQESFLYALPKRGMWLVGSTPGSTVGGLVAYDEVRDARKLNCAWHVFDGRTWAPARGVAVTVAKGRGYASKDTYQPSFAFVSAFVLVARPRFSISSSSRSAAAMASELIWCLRFCIFVALYVDDDAPSFAFHMRASIFGAFCAADDSTAERALKIVCCPLVAPFALLYLLIVRGIPLACRLLVALVKAAWGALKACVVGAVRCWNGVVDFVSRHLKSCLFALHDALWVPLASVVDRLVCVHVREVRAGQPTP